MTRIRTERLQLSTLGPSAAEQLLHYYQRNRTFFEPWLPQYGPDFFSEQFQADVLRYEQQLFKKSEQLRLFLFKLGDKRLAQILGDLRFYRMSQGKRIATLGYKLDEGQQAQGFMKEALSAAIPFVFQFWNIQKLNAYIPLSNTPSLKLIQRLGFEPVPKKKIYLELNGQYLLHHCYQLTKREVLYL